MNRVTSPSIDKLVLKYYDYSIKDYSIFGEKSNRRPNQDIGIISHYHNSEHFSVDVGLDRQGVMALTTAFNPSKVSKDHDKLLLDLGVKLNYSEGKILRLDICRDKKLDYNISRYFSLINSSMGGRSKAVKYDTTIRVGNKQGQICFYDKSIESKLSIPNIGRLEVRYLKPHSCMKQGVSIVSDLNGADLMQLYAKGGNLYLPNLNKLDASNEIISNAAMDLESLYGTDPRPLDTFLALGYLTSLGGIDALIEVIDVANISKQKKYNAKKRVRELSKKIASHVPEKAHYLRDEILEYFAA